MSGALMFCVSKPHKVGVRRPPSVQGKLLEFLQLSFKMCQRPVLAFACMATLVAASALTPTVHASRGLRNSKHEVLWWLESRQLESPYRATRPAPCWNKPSTPASRGGSDPPSRAKPGSADIEMKGRRVPQGD